MANVKQIKQKTTGTLLDIEDTQARGDIASEVNNRTNADKALDDKVKAETEARTSADNALNQKIAQETTNRTNADNALQTAVNAEAQTRLQADTDLQTNIGNEATARTNADNALQEKINTNKNDISELKSDLSNKLPKSPTEWEEWTAEEQAAARDRIGINEEFQRVFLLDEIWEQGTSLIVNVNNLSHLRIFISLNAGIISSVDNFGLISFTDSNGNRTENLFELGSISESNRDYAQVAYCKYDINDVPTMSRWAQVSGNPALTLRGGIVRNLCVGGIIPNFLVSKIHFPKIKGGVKIAIWGC